MKRMLLALALAGATLTAFAQVTPSTVTIAAKGDDVRSVISDMFKQTGKNFVINPGVRFVLYLSLDKVDFDEALAIVCRNANLRFEVQNGIYYISPSPAKTVEPVKTAPVKTEPVKTEPVKTEPVKQDKVLTKTSDKPAIKIDVTKVVAPVTTKPKKTLSTSVLAKRITTRYSKTDLREVMAAFTKQTGVPIEVTTDVPAYKLDAYLINTSLKYALDRITNAAKLEYRFTDTGSIQIVRLGATEKN